MLDLTRTCLAMLGSKAARQSRADRHGDARPRAATAPFLSYAIAHPSRHPGRTAAAVIRQQRSSWCPGTVIQPAAALYLSPSR
eukprot:CAMPEP_0172203050 /NCGR_PEP_ID=MMETSP1050-20130122/31038_1 /TAXON_ID=233186 /ORGANISM="Cryptomonas curvata, Strain CCAP979/52" /LENGTH=82 /DNA_ID=CAMNT_0012881161 /DNA_START=344 /DNA_END=588 /DNA_ORIENTATION=+